MSNDYNIKQILECNVSFSNQKKLKFLVRKRNIVKKSKRGGFTINSKENYADQYFNHSDILELIMSSVKSFEDLRIWQDSRTLVANIYTAFGVKTPASHDFGFRDQVQRASVSIMNNISEGYERRGNTEFYRFLTIAKGSCGELRNMLYIAEDLKYLNESDAENYRAASLKIIKGIAALMRHLKKDASPS